MKLIRTIVLTALLAGTSLQAVCQEYTWKAGWARTNITPSESVWQAGYAMRTAPSEGVYQDIWAKAVALEDASGKKAVLVTMDLLAIPRDFSVAVCDKIQKKYGLKRDQILLSMSHTHSAPVIGNSLYYIYPMDKANRKVVDKYTENLKKQLVDLVGEALKKSEPVRLYSGNGLTRIGRNRRYDGTSLSYEMLVGPSDYAVPVLKFEGMDEKIKVVLFGHACHPVVNGTYQISGDWAGIAQSEVEKSYPDAMGMFFQGCGADQNPYAGGGVPLSYMVQYGKQVAAAVEQVISEPMTPLESKLGTRYQEIDLPFDNMIPYDDLKAIAEEESWVGAWARGMAGKIDKGEKFPESYPYPIEYWTIGSQQLFALGGEVTCPYSINLKKKYGHDIFAMGYANDVMSYIPSRQIWEEGGYEGYDAPMVYALHARWTADVEDIIMNAIDNLLNSK
ncbi:MAG: neutral/alkaline non-lysosomal ceramidase N-terminal domain-containing protein [Bacteroidales bacterium]|nr:neutral/alkaline non-lysosomal ceramidase N-terminal domain-containing protein [Bacteroidales bacterium]